MKKVENKLLKYVCRRNILLKLKGNKTKKIESRKEVLKEKKEDEETEDMENFRQRKKKKFVKSLRKKKDIERNERPVKEDEETAGMENWTKKVVF